MSNGTESSNTPSPESNVVIIYDGECPFCKKYTQLLRLRTSSGNVRLINARSDDPQVEEVLRRGYDLDQGMIVTIDGQFYHGAQAMHVLAMLSSHSGWLNRFNYYVFRSKRVSFILYPLLRGGRNLALRILGHKQINHS